MNHDKTVPVSEQSPKPRPWSPEVPFVQPSSAWRIATAVLRAGMARHG
jgi:hypothetical protein